MHTVLIFLEIFDMLAGDDVIQGPHRLAVRTQGYHPCNRSSILLGVTENEREFFEHYGCCII